LTFDYRPCVGPHVSDIVLTSDKEATSSTSKEGIIEELKAMSKTLEETIRISIRRKISMEKMILPCQLRMEIWLKKI